MIRVRTDPSVDFEDHISVRSTGDGDTWDNLGQDDKCDLDILTLLAYTLVIQGGLTYTDRKDNTGGHEEEKRQS